MDIKENQRIELKRGVVFIDRIVNDEVYFRQWNRKDNGRLGYAGAFRYDRNEFIELLDREIENHGT